MKLPDCNVLFLISHDFGRRFGCYGDSNAVTPALDALARRAYRFDNHFCQWPLCGPSRANIFTGCRPLTTRRFDNQPFFASFRKQTGYSPATLPEAFRAAGYATAAFGFVYHDTVDGPSWSAGHVPVPEWADNDPDFADVPRKLLEGWRTAGAKELVRERWRALLAEGITETDLGDPAVERRLRGPAVERYDGPDDAYPDGVATDRAVQWLRSRGAAISRGESPTPFFCAIGFVAGHTPFRAPAQDWDRINRTDLVLPDNLDPPEGTADWAEGDSEPAQFYTTHGYTRPWRASRKESLELLHGHFAALSYTDRQIARILAALDETGEAERTVVVVTSDHGFSDAHHGYWGKHNLWDQGLQVPLLVALPSLVATAPDETPGSAASCGPIPVPALTEHVDLFPTLSEVCGVPVPEHLEGASFVHLFDRPDAPHKSAVFGNRKHMWHDRLQVYNLASTIRTERYRYTRYVNTAGHVLLEELFDYELDPDERRNVARDEAYSAIKAELAARLEVAG